MALDPDLASLVYRRILARITSTGGVDGLSTWARDIWRQSDPDRTSPFIEYLNVARAAERNWREGFDSNLNPDDPIRRNRIPRDPTLAAGTNTVRARVVVTATEPDGSTTSTLVVVDFAGDLTNQQVIDLAIQIAERDRGTNLSPPAFDRRTGNATLSGEVVTLGRS